MAKKRVYQSPVSWAEVDLATELAEAKRLFEESLAREGLTPLTARPVLKIKPMRRARGDNAHSIAVYRDKSAIMGSPIFWISDKFVETAQSHALAPSDVVENLLDTLCHEYGHALCDLLRFHDRRNGANTYEEIILETYDDEEDFAEEFGLWLADRQASYFVTETANAIKEALA